MFFIIFILMIALLPVYCVFAGLVELARHADRRRTIADAFAVGAAALTASMRMRRRSAMM